ncbi:MAG: FAD-dependent oxidoreductase [Acidiferrobacterales bacterium]
MFIDARRIPQDKIIETEVCIIGAGAAGITLAREFIGRPFRVCLLEGGGLIYDVETQALYKGEITGIPYDPLHVNRVRYFGGTTNHWSGWCRPLDDIDFEKRKWVPYSGWPFSKSHLAEHYKRAQRICQVGEQDYDPELWQTHDARPLPFKGQHTTATIFRHSPPTRFGLVYRDEIERAQNINTYLHANVVDIETTDPANTVTRVRVACLDGNKFWVVAKLFVLATGGIENARLLLLSNKVQKTGLGNQNDLVGRFFTDHPGFDAGGFLLSDPRTSISFYLGNTVVQGKRFTGGITLSPEVLRREGLVNLCALIYKTDWSGVYAKPAARALIRRREYGHFWRYVADAITNIDDMAVSTYRKMFKPEARRQLFMLVTVIEPAPNPDSRVTLSTETDALGKRRVRLHWQLGRLDRHSVSRAQELFATEFGYSGLGRVLITTGDNNDVPMYTFGDHHMGTTRMHVDPKQGVVDENCRVHGISNLFVAGSSVFPTFGYSQPTLTIVALALRLAEKIKGVMS